MARIGIIKIKNLIDGLLQYVAADYSSKNSMKGAVVHTTVKSSIAKKKDTLTLTGTTGKITITDTLGTECLLVFGTSLTITAAKFVTDYAALFLAQDVVITSSTNKIIFEALAVNTEFVSPVVRNQLEESFLYRCIDDGDIADGINYRELAVEIFTRPTTDHRSIETRLMFDTDRAMIPTVHIREPAKNKGKTDAIGYMGEDIYENLDGGLNEERKRSFGSQYELLITSANRHEVIIIEEVLLALLIGAQDTLALYDPFYVFEFSVKELVANNQLIPDPLFIKGITLYVSYDKTYPNISTDEMLGRILFEANLLSN